MHEIALKLNMKSKILIILTFLFSADKTFSQAKNTSDGKELIYNLSIGSVIGAVGAVINKKQEEKFCKTAFKGFCQGGLGGYVTFESKRLIKLAEQNKDWKILWCAKIINAGGISIKENASANKDFWEKWHINFGFNRIEFVTRDKFSVHYKVMPVALVYTIGIASQTKFEPGSSLKSGELIFSSYTDRFTETNASGVTFPGAVVLHAPFKNNFSILSHEIIHLYQANDFSQFDPFAEKPINYVNSKSETLKKINKYIYYDFRYLPQLISYGIEQKKAVYYYDNRFEREAAFFSNAFDPDIPK